jgi:peptidoglycan/LPS O-acetylase OafA/YrhL
MGILRLLLALSVVAVHSQPILGINLVGGQTAVQAFYMISGFYMAMVITEKYSFGKGSYKLFLGNRFLKLYPIYWINLLIVLLISIGGLVFAKNGFHLSWYIEYTKQMKLGTLLFFVVTNLVIFGQDLMMFLQLDKLGSLVPAINFRLTDPPLYRFLFVEQAWTIALEMTFYLFAPILVKQKTKWLVLLMSLSFGLRIILYKIGLNNDPWTYRFFPLELGMFLIGVIGYRVYRQLREKIVSKWFLLAVYVVVILSTFIYPLIQRDNSKMWGYYLLVAVSLPFIFLLFKNNKVDRIVGELSYPVYLCHFWVAFVIMDLMNIRNWSTGILVAFGSIGVSLLIVKLVVEPIDKIRQKRIAIIK